LSMSSTNIFPSPICPVFAAAGGRKSPEHPTRTHTAARTVTRASQRHQLMGFSPGFEAGSAKRCACSRQASRSLRSLARPSDQPAAARPGCTGIVSNGHILVSRLRASRRLSLPKFNCATVNREALRARRKIIAGTGRQSSGPARQGGYSVKTVRELSVGRHRPTSQRAPSI
jgi:hypothetical protein